MKKILFVVFIALFSIIPLFAANEYCQFGISYGVCEAMTAPYIGLHSQYQFGASFTPEFDLGFGTYADLDFSLSEKAGNNSAFSLLFGPAFAFKETDMITTTVVFGPEIRALEDTNVYTDEYDQVGFGFGGSIGYTFIPKEEQNARVSLGFTLGFSGSVFWIDDSAMQASGKAYFGVTLRGPLMFMPENDLYDEILWYGLNM